MPQVTETETEVEKTFCSSMNQENADGSINGSLVEGNKEPFLSLLTPQVCFHCASVTYVKV